MKLRTTMWAAAVIGVASAAIGLAPSAALADTPAGTAISPVSTPSGISQFLTPLAGEPGRVIYAQTQVLGNEVLGSTELEEYDGSGPTVDLGPGSVEYAGYGASYSLVGPILSTGQEDYPSTAVQWWNLDADTSGSATVPGNYLGSSSDGWYYYAGGLVYDETTAGVSTLVGQPFSSLSAVLYTADVGPDGIVLGDGAGDLVYMTDAGAVTTLQSQWSTYAPKDPANGVSCNGTNGTYTVCTVSLDGGDSDNTGIVAQLIPLDGSAPRKVSDVCMGQGAYRPSVALTATNLVCADVVVNSEPVGGGATSVSTYEVGAGIGYEAAQTVAAFGKAVVADPSDDALETVTDAASKPTTLLTAPKSDVTVGRIALTSGAISWTSDQVPSGSSSSSSSVRTRNLSQTSGSLTVGSASVTSPRSAWDGIARSGRTIADEVPSVHDGLTTYALRVTTPHRTTTVNHVVHDATLVSGNEVLYQNAESARSPKRHYFLLNAVTGKSRELPQLDAVAQQTSQGAGHPGLLWGDKVVYRTAKGAIHLLDTKTGKVTVVAKPGDNEDPQIYGSYVAWTAGSETGTGHGEFRNVATMAKPIALPTGTLVQQLTNSGIVTSHASDPIGGYYEDELVPTKYYLRGYGSTNDETEILDVPHAPVPAEVSDSVIAWIDGSYVARAAAISPKVLPTPRYLGTPYAPASITRHRTWKTNLPFSAVLKTCSVAIAHEGHVMATLSCEAGPMRYGDAVVAWSGKHATGKYVWTARVTGASGTTTKATGAITVT